MLRKFFSLFLILVVLVVLTWNAILTIRAGFDTMSTVDVRLLKEVAGCLELLLAVILLGVFVLLAKRKSWK